MIQFPQIEVCKPKLFLPKFFAADLSERVRDRYQPRPKLIILVSKSIGCNEPNVEHTSLKPGHEVILVIICQAVDDQLVGLFHLFSLPPAAPLVSCPFS